MANAFRIIHSYQIDPDLSIVNAILIIPAGYVEHKARGLSKRGLTLDRRGR